MSSDGPTSSESVLFLENKQAQNCIAVLVNDGSTKTERNNALATLRTIYDKYLECPTLIDPYLEDMVTSLAQCARSHLLADQPDTTSLPHALSALYALCKVRGYKRVQRFLPHETQDVEPVFHTLQRLDAASDSDTSGSSGPLRWESIYTLWVWMGMLSLVPFDCNVISNDSFLSSFLSLGKLHLAHAGPTRETASACLASWLARPDLRQELAQFVEWSHDILVACGKDSHTISSFVVMGTVHTLAGLVKTATTRSTADMERLWEPALEVAENAPQGAVQLRKLLVKWFSRMACAYLPPRVASWRYRRGRRCLLDNMRQSKTTSTASADEERDTPENFQEELFPVPDQVEDAMGFVLQSLTDSCTVVRWSAAKGVGRMTERLPSLCADDVLDAILKLCNDPEKDHAWHGACLALAELARRGLLLPGRLGDVVPLVIRAVQFDVRRGQTSVGANVRDAACYTYWAFARAYAPSVIKPYVTDLSRSLVLASLFDREVNCRRAASAAFQECVGRQGADNFKHGISILTTADYFSLGNLANAYTSIALHVAQFPEYRKPIISHLYLVKLQHWDPSIRNLSSKSLGRLAHLDVNFASNKVVPFLVKRSTDENLFVRHGAVLAVAELVLSLSKCEKQQKAPDFSQDVLASIAELVPAIEKARLYRGRGGEIMRSAVCRLIECISKARMPLTVKQQVRYLDSVDTCLKHPSGFIQEAASNALHALMRSYFPVGARGPSERLQKRVVDYYIQIVSTSINPAETRGFALALGVLPRKLVAPSSPVLSSVLDCLTGAACNDAKVGDESDAETRRNAIVALERICTEVGIGEDRFSSDPKILSPIVGLDGKQVAQVFESFLSSLDDYNIDRRGDVGSWSRKAAMSGLECLTYAAANMTGGAQAPTRTKLQDNEAINGDTGDKENTGPHSDANGNYPYFSESLCIRIFGSLLKQLSEKLDLVRNHAGGCLERLLLSQSPSIPHIPQKKVLLHSLGLLPRKHTNWANGHETYSLVMAAACVDEFCYPIIAGMVVSVGGLGESVAKPAEEALLAWVRDPSAHSTTLRVQLLADVLLKIFRRHQRDRRVTLPLLKTIDLLLLRGCLNPLVHTDDTSFPSSILQCLTAEANRCSDVHRLLVIVSVSLAILSCRRNSKMNEDILVLVFRMLGHPYPRVRRFTADHLYVRLIEDQTMVPNQEGVEAAMALLLEGQWDTDIALSVVRDIRDRIAELSGVRLPVFSSSGGTTSNSNSRTEMPPSDEFASYASLVSSNMS